MFEKFTFEKKLGINSSEKKYSGLKVGTVSLFVAFAGLLNVVLGAETFGKILVVISFLGMCVGIVIHLGAMREQASRSKSG